MATGDVIEYVHAEDAATADVTASFTVTPPEGSLILLYCTARINTLTVSVAPSGFTLLGSVLSDYPQMRIYGKIAGAAETNSYTITWSGTGAMAMVAANVEGTLTLGEVTVTDGASVATALTHDVPAAAMSSARNGTAIAFINTYQDSSLDHTFDNSFTSRGVQYAGALATAVAWADKAITHPDTDIQTTVTLTAETSDAAFAMALVQPTAAGTINAGTTALTITEHPANIGLGSGLNITTSSVAMTITTYPATVTVEIQGTSDSLAITEYPATIGLGGLANVNAASAPLAITTHAASIVITAKNVNAAVESMAITTYAATIAGTFETVPGGGNPKRKRKKKRKNKVFGLSYEEAYRRALKRKKEKEAQAEAENQPKTTAIAIKSTKVAEKRDFGIVMPAPTAINVTDTPIVTIYDVVSEIRGNEGIMLSKEEFMEALRAAIDEVYRYIDVNQAVTDSRLDALEHDKLSLDDAAAILMLKDQANG